MNKLVVNEHQPSLTEWFAAIGELSEANAFREEDNQKVQRLEKLYQTIGLPYERPVPFAAEDLFALRPNFAAYLQEHENEPCAIRLTPKREGLPKLRQRGLSLRQSYETWLLKQEVDPADYTAYICPHSEKLLWSMTFVVKEEGVFGEIVQGLHSQLTQGTTEARPIQFQFDFMQWQWSEPNSQASKQVKKALALLQISDPAAQKALRENLQAIFSQDYLIGYFEVTVWPGDLLYFIDYNRLLPAYISQPPFAQAGLASLKGVPAFKGLVQGRAVKVGASEIAKTNFPAGAILVCDNTDIRYLPLMQKAAAILTERGGMLSHAAIIARELKKPGIVGIKHLQRMVKEGDLLEVNANQGIVRVLN